MNPYRVLGVRENASDKEIAKAHKRLARRYHPDLNPGDDTAARKMQDINRAYEDIKALRRQGLAAEMHNAYDPEAEIRRDYKYYYKKPRIDPVAMILAAVVMMLFVRLVLHLLFGCDPSYPGGYYPNIP